MLSKARIRPYWPKQFDQFTEVFKAATTQNFTPGTLVTVINGLLVPCDTDTAIHQRLPAFMVWEDGSTRHDVGPVYNRDGTSYDNYTCFVGDVLADASAELFTATPEAGDTLVKSATAGKIDPLDAAQLATLLGSDVENAQLVIGVVLGSSKFGNSGFYSCKFNFGGL
jgi:hypothetical protein